MLSHGLKAQIPADKTRRKASFYSKRDSLSINSMVNKDFIIRVKKLTGNIKLDGEINEDDWLKAEKATDFYMVLPYDTGHSVSHSDVMMTYDDKAFYVAMIAYDTLPGKRIVESLRRDFGFARWMFRQIGRATVITDWQVWSIIWPVQTIFLPEKFLV